MKRDPNLLVLTALLVGYMGGVLSFKDGRVWVQQHVAAYFSEEEVLLAPAQGVIVRHADVVQFPLTTPDFAEKEVKAYAVFDRSVKGVVSISSAITIPTSRERHIRDLVSREVASMHVLVGTVEPIFEEGHIKKMILGDSEHALPSGYGMRAFMFFPDEVPISEHVAFVERLRAQGRYDGCVAGPLLDGLIVRGGIAVCLFHLPTVET